MRTVHAATRIPGAFADEFRFNEGGEDAAAPDAPLAAVEETPPEAAPAPIMEFRRADDAGDDTSGLAVSSEAVERAEFGGAAAPSWVSPPPGIQSVLERFGITIEAEFVESFARGGQSGKPTDGGGGGGGKGPKTDSGGGAGGGGGGDSGPVYTGDYVSGLDTPNGFNIDLVLNGDWPASLVDDLVRAAERLSDIIVGDVKDYNGIDDIRIIATLTTIDGGGGVVGSGGAGSLRTGSYLPATGFVRFDSADALNLLSRGMWDDLVLHEMMHAIGFGGLWSRMGLVTDFNGDLRFTGAAATGQYNVEFASIAAADPLSDLGVPVETDGGSGTAGAHWDEARFLTELMTGRLNGANYLSQMSVAALEDMGYQTVFGDDLPIA